MPDQPVNKSAQMRKYLNEQRKIDRADEARRRELEEEAQAAAQRAEEERIKNERAVRTAAEQGIVKETAWEDFVRENSRRLSEAIDRNLDEQILGITPTGGQITAPIKETFAGKVKKKIRDSFDHVSGGTTISEATKQSLREARDINVQIEMAQYRELDRLTEENRRERAEYLERVGDTYQGVLDSVVKGAGETPTAPSQPHTSRVAEGTTVSVGKLPVEDYMWRKNEVAFRAEERIVLPVMNPSSFNGSSNHLWLGEPSRLEQGTHEYTETEMQGDWDAPNTSDGAPVTQTAFTCARCGKRMHPKSSPCIKD